MNVTIPASHPGAGLLLTVARAEPASPRREITLRPVIPVVYTYLLDSSSGEYRDSEVFTGMVKATVPFPVEIDLSNLG